MWYALDGLALWAAATIGFALGSCWTAFLADRLEGLAKETYTRGRIEEIVQQAKNPVLRRENRTENRRPVP